MALPFLVPLLIGGTIGAITNKEDPLKGALMGGVLGALTGGIGAGAGAGSAAMGSGSAATSALGSAQAGLGAGASAANAAQASINAASGLNVGAQALGAAAPVAQTSLGAPLAQSALAKQSMLQKALSTAKDKPMETAQFASALGGPQEQQQPMMQAAPIVQPQREPIRSVEEQLSMATGDSPTFIPRGLFEESSSELEEDRLRRMQYQTV